MIAAEPAHSFRSALRALALLLHYPDPAVQAHSEEIADALAVRAEFSVADRVQIERFIRRLRTADLLHLQATYVETFDRSKRVSLYLFEHVHGESRARGQAMVELRMAYREKGMEMSANELPDYLPVFLEFCSQLSDEEASTWLEEISHILQEIHVRLDQRQSRYALPFRLLLRLIQVDALPARLVDTLAHERRDDTRAEIDRAWNEAPVTFGPGSASASCHTTPQQTHGAYLPPNRR